MMQPDIAATATAAGSVSQNDRCAFSCGERAEADEEPHEEIDLRVVHALHDAGSPGEHGSEHERQEMVRGTLMPISVAASLSMASARIAVPAMVLVTKSHSPSMSSRLRPNMPSCT